MVCGAVRCVLPCLEEGARSGAPCFPPSFHSSLSPLPRIHTYVAASTYLDYFRCFVMFLGASLLSVRAQETWWSPGSGSRVPSNRNAAEEVLRLVVSWVRGGGVDWGFRDSVREGRAGRAEAGQRQGT